MPAPGRQDETEAERADRNFSELLQEVRVAQTGVQILFGFMLTIPFQARFGELDSWSRKVFAVAIVTAALAAACLIAPVAFHRTLFRRQAKEWVVRAASRLAGVGLVLLAVTMVAALDLVLGVVYSRTVALITASAVGLVLALLWWVIPLRRRWRT